MRVLQRLKAIIRPSKPPIGPDYEKILADNFQRFLRAGDWVVDVGAHTGVHTAKMIKAIGTTGRVLAFEPLPINGYLGGSLIVAGAVIHTWLAAEHPARSAD